MSTQDCLRALDEAIAAAEVLRVDVHRATDAREAAGARLGFAGDVYVLALVGGTGVGKSSLLNALAGQTVSAAGPQRPTTADPVAWIPASRRVELAPLLQWLRVADVREHDAAALGAVAVLDLPDLDSIRPENRARVDELLPRVDAVAWIADPEKYNDALLHEDYLRRWGPALGRQLFVVNKGDRLARGDAERLIADIAPRLAALGIHDCRVMVTAASAGPAGVADLLAWVEEEAEAKEVIARRLTGESRAAVRDLAAQAGISDGPAVVERAARARAADEATAQVLRIVDLAGLERQAVAATRLAARPRGGGPMGHVTSAALRLSGRSQQVADPVGYLRRWRTRGSLAPAMDPVRRLLTGALPRLPPATRAALMASTDSTAVETRLAAAIDRAVLAPGTTFTPPTSRIWPVLGLGQYVTTALLLFAALWIVTLIAGGSGGQVATLDMPIIGRVPTPAVILFAGLVLGFVSARILGFSAGRLGRRWAGSLRAEITAQTRAALDIAAFAGLDELEAARSRLSDAARAAEEGCGG